MFKKLVLSKIDAILKLKKLDQVEFFSNEGLFYININNVFCKDR